VARHSANSGVIRARKVSTEHVDGATRADSQNLPVPVGAVVTHAPAEPAGGAAIEAQLLGQTGARRGLRAGATAIETANASYNKAEWSGKKDRRAPKGQAAKTEI